MAAGAVAVVEGGGLVAAGSGAGRDEVFGVAEEKVALGSWRGDRVAGGSAEVASGVIDGFFERAEA